MINNYNEAVEKCIEKYISSITLMVNSISYNPRPAEFSIEQKLQMATILEKLVNSYDVFLKIHGMEEYKNAKNND